MWESVHLNQNQPYLYQFGSKFIYFLAQANSFHYLVEESESFDFQKIHPIEKINLDNLCALFCMAPPEQVRFQPVLPELPVYFELAGPIYLEGEQSIEFYLDLPVHARLINDDNQQELVSEVFQEPYKKAIFGDTNSGALSIYHEAIPYFEPNNSVEKNWITFAINYENRSKKALIVNMLAINTKFLNVYLNSTGYLLTDKIFLESNGDLLQVQIDHLENPENESSNILLLAESQEKFKKNFKI